MKFSANLGFLWKDLALPAAIRKAKQAGFDAVECHWPFNTNPAEVKAALDDTNLPMLCLNTRPGNVADGEFGLTALPGREHEARAAIDEAIDYALAIGAKRIHVMSGIAQGGEVESCFVQNLKYACEEAQPHGITFLIEPINTIDVPGYFLSNIDLALDILDKVDRQNIKLMFDCYHVAKMNLDVGQALATVFHQIGHIQFASVPDRGPPGTGTGDLYSIFKHIKKLGYTQPLSAEYVPDGQPEEDLCWLDTAKKL